MQTAVSKMAAFSLLSKDFSECECCKFENCILGEFYELVYTKVFIFQYIEPVRISLGLGIIIYTIRLSDEKFLMLMTSSFA